MAFTSNQQITRSTDQRNGHKSAAVHHYEGVFAFINSSGYADVTTGSGANCFAGIVVDEVDNSLGAAGDLNVEVFAEGRFLLVGSGFTQATVGARVYATDNGTITTDGTAANAVYIGHCRGYVDSTHIYVTIDVDPVKLEVAQQAAYTQTYSTAARTNPAMTAVAVATTAPVNTSPYGYTTSAQAAAIVTNLNAVQVDVLALQKLVNAIIDDLQITGIAG